MSRKHAVLQSGAIAIGLVFGGTIPAVAQVGFGATPGYPSVSQYGGAVGFGYGGGYGGGVGVGGPTGYGDLGFGGFGTTPYSYPGATGYPPGGGVVNGLGSGGGVPGTAGIGGPEGVANALGGGGIGVGGVAGYGSGIGVGGASGIGTGVGLGYSPAYQVANGQPAPGVAGANTFYNAQPQPVQQNALQLQPLYNAINAVPGLNQQPPARHASRSRYHQPPLPPRSQMMNDDGTILWPSMTPNDESVAASRSAVDSAVKDLMAEAKRNGHASTRSVIDAKNKLHAFARVALPEVMTQSPKDERTLELFILHLAKTLEHFVTRY